MQAPEPRDGRRVLDWGSLVFGLLIVAVGAYLLLKDTLRIAVPEITWNSFWPVILIAVGAVVLLRTLTGNGRRSGRGR